MPNGQRRPHLLIAFLACVWVDATGYGVPGAAQASAATIHITALPSYGVDGFLRGAVTGVDFGTHRVAVYIQIEGLGWFTKPTFASPAVPLTSDGRFDADVATGGIDNRRRSTAPR